MLLPNTSPRLRATILASIIGMLAGVAAVCYLAHPLIFPGFGIILAFLFAGNFLNWLIFSFLGDYFLVLRTDSAFFYGCLFGNPVVYATLTWLLWPTVQKMKRVQIPLPDA